MPFYYFLNPRRKICNVISTEAMIWDPSDNMIKIHAEYLGNEIYLPSSSQEEVIVVYPTKDTKSC